MFTLLATDQPTVARPSRPPRPVACPRSPELGARLTLIVQALRAQEVRERENRAAELAKLRELQRFD
jgi:hypothetical protein